PFDAVNEPADCADARALRRNAAFGDDPDLSRLVVQFICSLPQRAETVGDYAHDQHIFIPIARGIAVKAVDRSLFGTAGEKQDGCEKQQGSEKTNLHGIPPSQLCFGVEGYCEGERAFEIRDCRKSCAARRSLFSRIGNRAATFDRRELYT